MNPIDRARRERENIRKHNERVRLLTMARVPLIECPDRAFQPHGQIKKDHEAIRRLYGDKEVPLGRDR